MGGTLATASILLRTRKWTPLLKWQDDLIDGRKKFKSKQRIKPYTANIKPHKSCQNLAETHKFVFNLSRHKLNDNEYSLLAKGLKFIPSPKQKNIKRRILKDFDEFARKLRCRYYFDTGAVSKHHPFRKSSEYQPPTTFNELEQYIDKTKLEL